MSDLFAGQTVAQIRERARNDAAATAMIYWPDGSIPVDPIQIARDLGAQVYSAQLGDDVYGMVRGGSAGTEIFFDVDNPPNRQRFTVAHELGHIVAYQGSLSAEVNFVERRSDSGAGNADEIYANEFAASLLMPADAVSSAFETQPNVFTLAAMFKVSTSAMGWRLRHLGLHGQAS